jgi:hypothetical protein
MEDGIENTQWLGFLRSFTAVKVLHMTGALPTVRNIDTSKMTYSTTVTRGARFTGASRSRKPRFERTFLVTLVFESVSVMTLHPLVILGHNIV